MEGLSPLNIAQFQPKSLLLLKMFNISLSLFLDDNILKRGFVLEIMILGNLSMISSIGIFFNVDFVVEDFVIGEFIMGDFVIGVFIIKDF